MRPSVMYALSISISLLPNCCVFLTAPQTCEHVVPNLSSFSFPFPLPLLRLNLGIVRGTRHTINQVVSLCLDSSLYFMFLPTPYQSDSIHPNQFASAPYRLII